MENKRIDYLEQLLEEDMVEVAKSGDSYMFQDQVEIRFARGFYISRFPVTQGLWKAVMGADKNPSHFKGDERPVEQVSWEDIVGNPSKGIEGFLYHLNKMPKVKESGYTFRLASETEWEYAARGGKYWKDGLEYAGSNRLKEVGWYDDNSHQETKPVGLKKQNQLGLYDMSGNVDEWCQDVWHKDDEVANMQKKDGTAWMEGGKQGIRVVRGGSWSGYTDFSRVAVRYWFDSINRDYDVGFRLARY